MRCNTPVLRSATSDLQKDPAPMTTRFPIQHLIPPDRTLVEIAEDLRISSRTLERWMASGVTWERADDFCTIVLNDHPVHVYGQPWEQAAGYDHLASIDDIADDCTRIPRPVLVAS